MYIVNGFVFRFFTKTVIGQRKAFNIQSIQIEFLCHLRNIFRMKILLHLHSAERTAESELKYFRDNLNSSDIINQTVVLYNLIKSGNIEEIIFL